MPRKSAQQRIGDKTPPAADGAGAASVAPPDYGIDFIDRGSANTPNKTGMPDHLKSGIESLSGMDLSDVRVHKNSARPNQFLADAFAQGNDIHLGPGQERHLPHEAWHVVQQRQGRVQPTMRAKGAGINLDAGLEREADAMGARALSPSSLQSRLPSAADSARSAQLLGQSTTSGAQARQFGCGSSKNLDPASLARWEEIREGKPVDVPRIGFRYDSRPIGFALKKGYKAVDPKAAQITEGGENQSLVGVAHHYVGAFNYHGFAKTNASTETKQKWLSQGFQTYYLTAVVVRSGGYTYEWLLDKITDRADRERVRTLILTRAGGEADDELQEIARKYPDVQGIKNVGTTEITTTKVASGDILGYFEINIPLKGKGERTTSEYIEIKNVADIRGYEGIPDDDMERFNAFIRSGGEIEKSNFI